MCDDSSGSELHNAFIFLAHQCMTWHELRHKAISLPPEECKDFLKMKFPIIQGYSNHKKIKQIGELPFDTKKIIGEINRFLEAHNDQHKRLPGSFGNPT